MTLTMQTLRKSRGYQLLGRESVIGQSMLLWILGRAFN